MTFLVNVDKVDNMVYTTRSQGNHRQEGSKEANGHLDIRRHGSTNHRITQSGKEA